MKNSRQLIIVRHGKSSWSHENVADIDRHLKERGIHDAYTMAERLKKNSLFPELVMSSPAARALHTALIFARTLKHPFSQLQLQDDFYHGDEQDVLDIIRQAPDDKNSLMIFGHNPTFTDLANLFLPDALEKLPTTGMAFIEFETGSWQKIDKEKVVKTWTDSPKNK